MMADICVRFGEASEYGLQDMLQIKDKHTNSYLHPCFISPVRGSKTLENIFQIIHLCFILHVNGLIIISS